MVSVPLNLPNFTHSTSNIELLRDCVRRYEQTARAARRPLTLQGWLDELEEEPPRGTPAVISEKLASMACKAAVKGNMRLSAREMEALLDQLLKLENPYHCPHGRPTIITMSRNELEKKFKRIV